MADRWLCSPGLCGFGGGRSAVSPLSIQITLIAPSGPTAISGLIARRPSALTLCAARPGSAALINKTNSAVVDARPILPLAFIFASCNARCYQETLAFPGTSCLNRLDSRL